MRSHLKFVFALLLLVASAASGLPLERIKLPAGFSISVFSDQVPGARSMARSPEGILYVGTQGPGKVYALVDRNGDGRADEVHTVASGLNRPNGVAWKDGALYVAEISRILRLDGIDDRLKNPPKPVVVTDAYPKDTHHGWKFIRFGPDGNLYVPVGAPCNICDPENPIYSTITRISPKGGKPEIFAKGIRNTVGFDWHPQTRELWFTENGRDWAGDDSPPDELDHAPKAGLHFGFPYCNANTPDKKFGKNRQCSEFVPPAIHLGPHVAALGMRFYTGTMFPEPYRGQIFIAEHGSWNRSEPIGYRVTLVRLQGNKAVSYETFAEGWLTGGAAWGRPVDVEVLPDGAMLVSDDKAGAIYRIAYAKK
jgi:glucose/arabinose dehydrogenase